MTSKWINISDEIDQVFSCIKNKHATPLLLILTGVGYSGKSTIRKNISLEQNLVSLDAGDIYYYLTYGRLTTFPPLIMREELDYIGNKIVERALEKRYSLVVEFSYRFCHKNPDKVEKIKKKFEGMSYGVRGIFLKVDLKSIKSRYINSKAYYDIPAVTTDKYHYNWLMQ